MGLLLKITRKLQLVLKPEAHMLSGASRMDHIIPTLQDFHWFTVVFHAQFEVVVITHKALYCCVQM